VCKVWTHEAGNQTFMDVMQERGWKLESPYRMIGFSQTSRTNIRKLQRAARGAQGFKPIRKHALWWCDYDQEAQALMNSIKAPGDHLVGRVPGMERASTKINFTDSLAKMDNVHYYPKAFTIPRQKNELLEQCKKTGEENHYWIAKPSSGWGGKGLAVYHKDQPEFKRFVKNEKRPIVVQRYIHNPCLIQDRKFNIRVYVILTSAQPLEIHVSKRISVEVGARPFKLSKGTCGDKFDERMHIINWNIQRVPEHGEWLADPKKPDIGEGNVLNTKMFMSVMKRRFPGFSEKNFWDQVSEASLGAVRAMVGSPHHSKFSKKIPPGRFFDLYGVDLMLDENLKVWLLEANTSVGMSYDKTTYPGGFKNNMKKVVDGVTLGVLHDMISLLGVDTYRKGSARNVIKVS